MSSDFVFSCAMICSPSTAGLKRLPARGVPNRTFRSQFSRRGSSVAACPVDLPPGTLRRTLRRVERVADPLTSVVEVPAGTLGRALLMASGQGEGDYDQAGKQNAHV